MYVCRMSDKIFKSNLRSVCNEFGVKAADIVAGTGLSDSQVYEMYNPQSTPTVSLQHALLVVKFLKKQTKSLLSVDYLANDHQLTLYYEMTKKVKKHLLERSEHLDYYENNLKRLQQEQSDYISYLNDITALLEPLDL